MLDSTSQISFMYFEYYETAKEFFENTLELKMVYDPGWACVYEITDGAFIGAVNSKKGSVKYSCKGGMLISITVTNIEEVYNNLSGKLDGLTDIKEIESVGLRSFFFKGPEGYDFEIQEFMREDLKKLF